MNGKLWGRWHHQLTHLHIHIDWSRNVSWKFARLQSVITSLLFNRFSSGFPLFCSIFLTLSYEIKLNLFWISSLRGHFEGFRTTVPKYCNLNNHHLTLSLVLILTLILIIVTLKSILGPLFWYCIWVFVNFPMFEIKLVKFLRHLVSEYLV